MGCGDIVLPENNKEKNKLVLKLNVNSYNLMLCGAYDTSPTAFSMFLQLVYMNNLHDLNLTKNKLTLADILLSLKYSKFKLL